LAYRAFVFRRQCPLKVFRGGAWGIWRSQFCRCGAAGCSSALAERGINISGSISTSEIKDSVSLIRRGVQPNSRWRALHNRITPCGTPPEGDRMIASPIPKPGRSALDGFRAVGSHDGNPAGSQESGLDRFRAGCCASFGVDHHGGSGAAQERLDQSRCLLARGTLSLKVCSIYVPPPPAGRARTFSDRMGFRG